MSDAVMALEPAAVGSSFAHFWGQGDGVSHAAAGVLLVMSVLSWTFILLKLWQFSRFGAARGAVAQFWQAASFEQGLAALEGQGPLLRMAVAGREAAEAWEKHASLGAQGDKEAVVTRALRQSMADGVLALEGGLSVLASIGAVAPFVGLFGTVWGIYHALMAIGVEGSANLGTVSGPVGEALVMTAAGLFVAIPAVLGYNAFSRAMRKAAAVLDGFAFDLQAYLAQGDVKKPGLQVAKA